MLEGRGWSTYQVTKGMPRLCISEAQKPSLSTPRPLKLKTIPGRKPSSASMKCSDEISSA